MQADVNTSALTHALRLAARGEWASLARAYAEDLSVFDGGAERRECFLRTVLSEPCPPRPCRGTMSIKDRR